MLQALYVDVAKVDRDVAHVVMAIHVCFKCISKMFHLFHMNVAIGLFGCCKNGSRYYIYMHVASICFKYFQVFYAYICKCFIWMLHILQWFSNVFQALSQVFHVPFFMLQLLHLDVSKVHFGCCTWDMCGKRLVAHTASGRHGRRPERRGPITGALTYESDALDARSLSMRVAFGR
jgi:hypothetical protein